MRPHRTAAPVSPLPSPGRSPALPDVVCASSARPTVRAAQPLLLTLLAAELANESKEHHVRQLAGVVLKNCVSTSERSGTSEESNAARAEKAAAWLAIGEAERQQIKSQVRLTLLFARAPHVRTDEDGAAHSPLCARPRRSESRADRCPALHHAPTAGPALLFG